MTYFDVCERRTEYNIHKNVGFIEDVVVFS